MTLPVREDLPSLVETWRTWGRRRALLAAGREVLSFAELADAVPRAAASLVADGAAPGRRIGLHLGNDPASVVSLLGMLWLGAAPLLLDSQVHAIDLRRVLRVAGMERVLMPAPLGSLGRTRLPPATPRRFGLVTSGTNGVPKIVGRDWRTSLRLSRSFAAAAGYGEEDVVLCTTPLHHSYALSTVLLAGLLAGATIALPPAPSPPAGLLAFAETVRATVILSVPFVYRQMLGNARPLPGLRLCVSAGERLDADLQRQWSAATGTELADHYGATEICVGTLGIGAPAGSAGPPLADVRIGIDGLTREVLVRIRGRHSVYWGQPALTRERFRDGWYHTDDVGRMDDAGNLYLEGRLARQLIMAGRKVDPFEVEAAIREYGGIRDCLVASDPHADADRPVSIAYVAPERDLDELALRRFLAARMSTYKVPTRIVWVPSIPRTSSGKPQAWRIRI